MRIRTKLILAFVALSVLPLGGVTLYSYYSSLSAFRKAVHKEANVLAKNMSVRVESVRLDLDRRIRGLGHRPFQALVSGPEHSIEPAVYSELVTQLGELADVIEVIEIAPNGESVTARSGHTQVRTGRVPDSPDVPGPPPPPPLVPLGPGIVIGMPGLADLHASEKAAEGQEGNVVYTFEVPSGDRFEVYQPGLAEPGKQPEGRPAPLKDLQSRRIAQIMKRAERAAIKKLNEGLVPSVERIFAPPAFVASIPGKQTSEDRVECFDLSSRIEMPGEEKAQLIAQISARRILGGVLGRTVREEGELPFAVDQLGRLYTAKAEDFKTLEALGIDWDRLSEGPSWPRDWMVVARKDTQTTLTFGIAKPIGEGLQEVRQAAARNLAYGLGMVGIALMGILPLSGRMTRNLKGLTAGAEELARGNLDARVAVRSRDEFGSLSDTFNRMARDLKKFQERMVEQERIRKELEISRRIQQEMLPQSPLRLPFAEVQGVSIPAREVGGDFFNYFPLEEGRVCLLIGDVSGKGVPAALLMANIQATLRARLPLTQDLAELATALDEEVFKSTQPEIFLTLFMAILDGPSRRLRWLNAGHNTQYLLKNGGRLEPMASSGRPVGLLPGSRFEEGDLPLDEGDTILLYTDGLVEAENEAGEEFGERRLEAILSEERASDSARILAHLEEEVRRHRGTSESGDDATMVVLRAI